MGDLMFNATTSTCCELLTGLGRHLRAGITA